MVNQLYFITFSYKIIFAIKEKETFRFINETFLLTDLNKYCVRGLFGVTESIYKINTIEVRLVILNVGCCHDHDF